MAVGADDWRRQGQESYLSGLRWAWRRYQVLSGNWEHEHCEFCFKSFLDASYSDSMREALAADPDKNASGGFANLRHDETPAGRHWVCRACFDDFRAEFHWELDEEADPNSWPYDAPGPAPRPTAADYDPGTRGHGP